VWHSVLLCAALHSTSHGMQPHLVIVADALNENVLAAAMEGVHLHTRETQS
jgi:hypothetical protein